MLRIVQLPNRKPFDLVIVYHLTAELDNKLKESYPGSMIINETYPPGGHYGNIGPDKVTPIAQVLSFAKIANTSDVRNLIIVGFSEGCQAPRTLLLSGCIPSAILAVDGIHNNKNIGVPGGTTMNMHVIPWKQYADLAKKDERILIITHSSIIPPDFASTTQMAKIILDPDKEFEIITAGDDPKYFLISSFDKGLFRVMGYSGGDVMAHVFQATQILPQQLKLISNTLFDKSFPWSPGGNKMSVDITKYDGNTNFPPIKPPSVVQPVVIPPPTPRPPPIVTNPPIAVTEEKTSMRELAVVSLLGLGLLFAFKSTS